MEHDPELNAADFGRLYMSEPLSPSAAVLELYKEQREAIVDKLAALTMGFDGVDFSVPFNIRSARKPYDRAFARWNGTLRRITHITVHWCKLRGGERDPGPYDFVLEKIDVPEHLG